MKRTGPQFLFLFLLVRPHNNKDKDMPDQGKRNEKRTVRLTAINSAALSLSLYLCMAAE
jgi:hypothetical protein